MNDTQLHFRGWINNFDGFGKPAQAVNTGNKDLFQAPILEFRQN